MERYLITTADERSWVFDRPVLFLGEWCCRYDRQHIWSKMDAIVAEPYGLDVEQKKQNWLYIQSIIDSLLIELTEVLNNYHNTQYNTRYWNIVVGHWLRRYVCVAFNRYQVLDQVLKNHKINGTTILAAKQYSLATADSSNFIWACNDDLWNHVMFSKILECKHDLLLNYDPSPLDGITGFCSIDIVNNQKLSLLKKSSILAKRLALRLQRETDAFIISSYLPLKELIKLHLSLGQIPQSCVRHEFIGGQLDSNARQALNINFEHHKGVERCIRKHIFDVMPSCYIEGYKILVDDSKLLNWPNNPKFIYTSNNFDTDEVFKVWVGSQVNRGIPYFVGQHGNNYGSSIASQRVPDLTTCDKFLSWGWSVKGSNILPAFIFTVAGKKKNLFDPCGGILLIESPLPHRLTPFDNYYEFGLYQEDQFKFVSTLPANISQVLTVRLHHTYKKFSWCDELRWRHYDPSIQLDVGVLPINKLIAKSRLIVHSYDSTGMLETLALNIPTICFWNHGFDHLIPEAKPYYQLLQNVGILHDTPEQAANLIAMHWDNLSAWWSSTELQEARNIFCNQYAKIEKHPVRKLKKLIQSEMI